MQSNWQTLSSLFNKLKIDVAHFSPPMQYRANLLQIIIYLNLIVTVIFMIFLIADATEINVIALPVMVLVIAINLWALTRIRRGHIQMASRIVIALDWAELALACYISGGIYSSAMMGVITLLVVATLILEARDRIICFIATLILFFVLLIIELSGYLPESPFKDIPLRMMVLVTVATTIFLTIRYHLYASKKSEKQITRLKVDAERYKVQRELTQDLAHDLRTPLSTLQTTAYLIRQRQQRDMPIEEALQTLEGQVQRINGMIEDLFQMTLLDVMDKQKTLLLINLSKILPVCIENARSYADSRGITITYEDNSGGEGQILGDHKQLVSVFDNLLTNAIHYGRDNGYIKVKLSFSSPYITASVEDNGIGIALEHQEKVFERFYRVDSARHHRENQGAGVGLNAVQRIVQFHGGNIYLMSEPGKGSTFTVTIPSIDHVKPEPPYDVHGLKYESDS
mgnify:CR=1 FL=1